MLLEPWPPDYVRVFKERITRLDLLQHNADMVKGAKLYYKTRCEEFIEDLCFTYDPRIAFTSNGTLPTYLPFILFKRQKEFIQFILGCLQAQEGGLVEKCRDVGATWLCCCISVWLWLFYPGAAIGWGSRKEALVDAIGMPDSIFEKIRIVIMHLPRELWPVGFNPKVHMPKMKILNPENGASIQGELGDGIGRGGRKLIYFKDESAHYEHPETIEASVGENTRVPIDISSVNGLGNVFHRRRENGVEWHPGEEIVKGKTNVFVFDVFDHPAKTREWYEMKRQKAIDDGLLHIFAQEIDRNYAAAKEGVIIPAEWILSAIDAHIALGFDDSGLYCAGLDLADLPDKKTTTKNKTSVQKGDKNALAIRKGVILKSATEWGERDVGVTTRKAIGLVESLGAIEVQYDCIGIGSSVKAEINRLQDETENGIPLLPRNVAFVPWNAGTSPQNPEQNVIPFDTDTPLNEDFFDNRKAQGWWNLRRRFEKTHRAITENIVYPIEELISLPSDLPNLQQIRKELSQPTCSKGARLKLVVDKTPDGTKSPNIGDAIMMCYDPEDTCMSTWTRLAGQI